MRPCRANYNKKIEFYYELFLQCMRTNLIEVCVYTFNQLFKSYTFIF